MGDGEKQTYTLAEVAEHSDNQSLWVVIDSKVYDITKFMEEVPYSRVHGSLQPILCIVFM